MLDARSLKLDLALLGALAAMPDEVLLREDTLCADAARIVAPRPTQVELDLRIRYLDTRRRIAGLVGETGPRWQITDLGRLWLASAS